MTLRKELEPGGIADTVPEGDTTDAYVTILDWVCLGYGKKTVLVENTGDTNDCTIKAFVRAYPGGIQYPEILYYTDDVAEYERQLTPGDMQRLRFNNAYAEIEVQIKSTVAESATTYRIDWNGTVTG
jgi:hypothetical protein